MQSLIRLKPYLLWICVVILVVGTLFLSVGDATGFSPKMRRGMLKGPWEIAVQIADGAPMRFPVEVPDTDKVADLDKVLPLPGSSIKIRLTKYLPNLKRTVSGVKDSSGSVIALVRAWGPDLDKNMWLNAADAKKRGINSSAGAINLVEIHDPKKLEEILKQLARGESAGILSVWPDKTKKPLQFVIRKGQTLSIPELDYSLKILDYMPHYSIDTETRKVKNVSDQPVNPAIKVSSTKGDSIAEQWLWSRLPASPHSKVKLPFRTEFTSFDFGKKAGRYILVGAVDSEPWIMFFKDGKVVAEKAETGKDYPMSDARYAVTIKEYYGSGLIKNEWKNGDESLANPAIVALVRKGQKKKEIVLEMGKPGRYSDDGEAIAFLFRQKANPKTKGSGKGVSAK